MAGKQDPTGKLAEIAAYAAGNVPANKTKEVLTRLSKRVYCFRTHE